MIKDVVHGYSSFISTFGALFLPSLRTDLILLLVGIKPCLRTKVQDYQGHEVSFTQWGQEHHLFHAVAFGDFFYLSPSPGLVQQAKQIDHALVPHERSFGHLLGYPECCCEKIASLGEGNIDAYEMQLVKEPFKGEFTLINPASYRQGQAFISHVPCSTTCMPSLIQAKKFTQFLESHRGLSLFAPWIEELEKQKGDCHEHKHTSLSTVY